MPDRFLKVDMNLIRKKLRLFCYYIQSKCTHKYPIEPINCKLIDGIEASHVFKVEGKCASFGDFFKNLA